MLFRRRKRLKILAELLRKSWHFFAGLILITGYSLVALNYSKEIALVAVVVVLLAAMEFEHVRIEYKPRLFRAIDVLFRKKEFNQPSSMLSFIISFIIIFAVFEHMIAFTAMLMMIAGDAFSAGFGMLFGEKKIRGKKTYVGSFAGLISNLIVGWFVLTEYPQLFIPMALTATVIETLTNKLDDNLTVPVSTAFVGYLLSIIWHVNF
jgi:dolichol kinase